MSNGVFYFNGVFVWLVLFLWKFVVFFFLKQEKEFLMHRLLLIVTKAGRTENSILRLK